MGACCEKDTTASKMTEVEIPAESPKRRDLSKYRHYDELIEEKKKMKKSREEKWERDREKLEQMERELEKMKRKSSGELSLIHI